MSDNICFFNWSRIKLVKIGHFYPNLGPKQGMFISQDPSEDIRVHKLAVNFEKENAIEGGWDVVAQIWS